MSTLRRLVLHYWRRPVPIPRHLLLASLLLRPALGTGPALLAIGVNRLLSGAETGDFGFGMVVLCVGLVATHVSQPVEVALDQAAERAVDAWVPLRLFAASANARGLDRLLDPNFHTSRDVAETGAATGTTMIPMLATQVATSLLSVGLLLSAFSQVDATVLAILALFGLVTLASETVLARRRVEVAMATYDGMRRSDYLRSIPNSLGPAEEVRTFDAWLWLRDRMSTDIARRRARLGQLANQALAAGLVSAALVIAASVVAIALALRAVQADDLPAADLVLVLPAVAAVAQLMSALSESSGQGREALGWLQTFWRFSEMEPDLPRLAPFATAPGRPVVIEFDRVSFDYPNGHRALADVSLRIEQGRSLAVVGENGSGKTTLLRLLLRLHDPTEGTVRVNGIDIRRFDLVDYRRLIAVMAQDFGRYQVTARENLSLGADIPDDDLNRCLAEAGLQSASEEPAFLDTTLSYEYLPLEGDITTRELSGGQWQRVALARLLTRAERPIWVLDEPTSALDPSSDAAFGKLLLDRSRERTCVIVSHRLQLVHNADVIVAMNQGRIEEFGTHAELLTRQGSYAAMYNSQVEALVHVEQ